MKSSVSLLIIFSTLAAFSQNLVPNPGFEEFTTCPQGINAQKNHQEIAPHWYAPTQGTPDLYNKCSLYMGIQNVTGFTKPYAGAGFAGLIVWEGKRGFREYLQVRLTEPLQADQVYTISFYYKLSSYSKYCADRIGLALTDTAAFYKSAKPIPIQPTFTKIKAKALDAYTGTWELLETTYTAKGGEKYLTIGNFHDNVTTQTTALTFLKTVEPMLAEAAYYYIDEVSITALTLIDTLVNDVVQDDTMLLDELYTLKNVSFDFNSAALLSSSFEELDKIIKILSSNHEWKVRISGHTDHVGSDQYNKELSEKRAYAVKEYMVSNGIAGERIFAVGYGESSPVTQDTHEGSQKKNRRVDILFYK